MTVARETVYGALFTLVAALRAPGAVNGSPDGEPSNGVTAQPGTPTSQKPFKLVSREVIEVQRVPPGLQPVLFLDDAMEDYVFDGRGLLHNRWTIYFHVGCTTIKGTAASTVLNPLLDLLQQTLAPGDGNYLGLGDVIAEAQFTGLSIKNLGNNFSDPNIRQAVAYVPFQIIFPPQ
jgi:hypothetical protein